jgi:CubicO group peptidase (beta-lactamase class C family)
MTMFKSATGLSLFLLTAVHFPIFAQDAEPAAETGPDSGPMPGLEAFVDGAVDAVMAEHEALPGITISVVKDGEIILLKGYGMADVESATPVDPDKSMFRIGSITKTFTGLAVMQLVEQGKLDLDEDVNTYLTKFSVPATFEEPVTLRALLSHRDGFEDGAAGYLFVRNAEEVLPLGEFLEKYMPQRVRPVGKTSTYTNYGISLAGYIVEVVSGVDYATYIEENIFKPLGMSHSTVREPLGADHPHNISPELESWLVTGYSKGPDGKPLAKPFDFIGQVGPAGSISSSALDMARYMKARLEYDRYDGGRLVSPQTTARMRYPMYNDRPLKMDMGYAMGEGWRDGYRMRWHNGGTTTFFSDMTLYPDLKLGIFISTNSTDGGPSASGRIPRLIFEKYFPSRVTFNAPEPPADFMERGQKYAGRYLLSRRSYTKLEKIAALSGQVSFAVDSDGYLVQSGGGQSIRWVEMEPGVFQSADPDPEDRGRSQYLYFYENDEGMPVQASFTANDPTRITYLQSPSFFFLALGIATALSLTTLLGAWRRAFRKLDQSGGGRWASRFSKMAALAVLAAAAGLGMVTAQAASGDMDALMFDWPGSALKVTLLATVVVIVLTIGMVLTLRAAWKDAGWNAWRRIHYTLYTLSLIAMLFAFNEWNMLGFKYF